MGVAFAFDGCRASSSRVIIVAWATHSFTRRERGGTPGRGTTRDDATGRDALEDGERDDGEDDGASRGVDGDDDDEARDESDDDETDGGDGGGDDDDGDDDDDARDGRGRTTRERRTRIRVRAAVGARVRREIV